MHDKITSHITQHKNFGRRNLGMSKFVILFNITKGTLQYLALLMPMFHVFAILNTLFYLQKRFKR